MKHRQDGSNQTAPDDAEHQSVDLDKKERLRETAAMFTSVLQESPLAIAVVDHEGKVIIWNPAAERLFGWTAAEALESPLANIPSETRRELEIMIEATLEGETFTGVETLLQRKDQQLINVALSSAPFYDGQGRILGTMAVMVDISYLKRAEEIMGFLSRAGAELTLSLEVTQILESLAGLALPMLGDYIAIDLQQADGTIQRVATRHLDPAKAAVAEAHRQYVPTQRQAYIRPRTRPGQPEILPEVSDTWLVHRAQSTEHLRLMRRLAPRSIMIVPLHVRDRLLGTVMLALTKPGRRYGLRDLQLAQELTQRAALAIDNANLFEETRQAVQARDDVLAIVSHDLRNPINTISMTAELLQEQTPAGEGARLLEIIQRSTQRMDRLIRDLLDVARIEAGGITIRPTDQDPAELVREAVELQQPLAREEEIQLTAEIPQPLPTIDADRDRLLQVFQNLLENALKFTPRNGVITVRAEPAPDAVRFSVRDSGSGIDPEELPHLFDRFWQARKTTKAGAGLGLAIARGIVEAHGGRIQAESRLGVGTTITFTIPVHPGKFPASPLSPA
jgi:PAS domain S-box-containing protein